MKKVLIICAGLQFGGAERFAANIIKYAPESEFSFDYLIFDGLGDAFAPEIKSKGGRVICIPSPSTGYFSYIKTLGKLINENKYDVVHSQTQFNSGINLWIAKKLRVPVRISHSHTTAHENSVSIKQRCYESLMRFMIRKNATHCCACGVAAGEWMYGKHPFQVINNGIDTDSFSFSMKNRNSIRRKYNISNEAFVIGHSGTLSQLKNQEFLIELMPEIKKRKPESCLFLMGTGREDYIKHLEKTAAEYGVTDSVIFTGAVMNVNEYLSAFDVFAFPSQREGTPLALLEAQANGLPCVISDAVPPDAIITDLVKQLPLNDREKWIDNICKSTRVNSDRYSKIVKEYGYDVAIAYKKLYKIYRGE